MKLHVFLLALFIAVFGFQALARSLELLEPGAVRATAEVFFFEIFLEPESEAVLTGFTKLRYKDLLAPKIHVLE